jgi:tetratricopeptide (TPR) repeat protein
MELLIIVFAGGIILAIVIAISIIRNQNRKPSGHDGAAWQTHDPCAPGFDQKKFYRETIGEEAYKAEKAFDKQIARNNAARGLEAQGKIEEAIKIYEKLLAEGAPLCEAERLAIIYRKRKQYQNEIRVIERDIEILEKGTAWKPPIEERKLRLEKARALAAKLNPT